MVERDAHVMESIGQAFEYIVELAPLRGRVIGHDLITAAADFLVEAQVRPTARAAALRVLVENAADEKRVVADVGADKKGLLRRGACQRNQNVGKVLMRAFAG